MATRYIETSLEKKEYELAAKKDRDGCDEIANVGLRRHTGQRQHARVLHPLQRAIRHSIQRRRLEDPCRHSRQLPIQITLHRLHKQDIPPKVRRHVSAFDSSIDELSGSVCLDVINQTWSPMFEYVL